MDKKYFITSEESVDNFVGIRFEDGVPQVVFPHGFAIANNETERRKDVFKLLNVLMRFNDIKSGDNLFDKNNLISDIPIKSYLYIIQNFLECGYYTEKENKYINATKGKINWKRTIQKEKSYLDKSNIIYLNFQIKTNQNNTNNLITEIHSYCVYKSIFLFGWLFYPFEKLPLKPQIKYDKKIFTNILKNAMNNTFNDTKRKLFQSMINILISENECIDINNCSIGVKFFDKIWERLIDFTFGEVNKNKYFPHAKWHIIKNDKIIQSTALEPDTIMKYQDKIYVLDAKYYQFGITEHFKDLPNTSSIQKQITYGKHVAEKFCKIAKENVYNAFIMPFNAKNSNKMKFVSIGTADWEEYNEKTLNYAYVLGILIDTKWLITECTKHRNNEIEELALLIEKSLAKYKHIVKIYEKNLLE